MLFPSFTPSLLALLALASAASAVSIESSDHSLEARSSTTCKAVGQYPVPQNKVCKPCSWKFPGSSRCTTSVATKCASGVLALDQKSCVKSCPTSQYSKSGVCTACSKTFAGSSTCTASGATKCSAGYLSNGKCVGSCPSGSINIASTKTCAACNTLTGAKTCASGKISVCNPGFFLNSAKSACVSCTTVDPNALTCSSSTVITSCVAPFTAASNKKQCQLGNTWSFYLSSSIPDVPYTADTDSAVLCGRNAAANAQPVSVWDPDTSNCYESAGTNATLASTLVWDDNASVFMYGKCATNNKLVPSDATSRCYDAIMTGTACTLTATGSACTTLGNNCNSNQFRNTNGLCQDCQAVYDDSLTCDLFNGATSCVDGSYPTDAGVCSSCTDFDANAATCTNSAAPVLSCNYGYLPSTDNTSCVVDPNAAPPTALDNAWSYYMDSYASGLTAFVTDSVTDAFDCAEQVYAAGLTLSAWDSVASNCYAQNVTADVEAAIAEVDGNAVFILGTCADNNDDVSDEAAGACNDVTIDGDSCSFGDGTACF